MEKIDDDVVLPRGETFHGNGERVSNMDQQQLYTAIGMNNNDTSKVIRNQTKENAAYEQWLVRKNILQTRKGKAVLLLLAAIFAGCIAVCLAFHLRKWGSPVNDHNEYGMNSALNSTSTSKVSSDDC